HLGAATKGAQCAILWAPLAAPHYCQPRRSSPATLVRAPRRGLCRPDHTRERRVRRAGDLLDAAIRPRAANLSALAFSDGPGGVGPGPRAGIVPRDSLHRSGGATRNPRPPDHPALPRPRSLQGRVGYQHDFALARLAGGGSQLVGGGTLGDACALEAPLHKTPRSLLVFRPLGAIRRETGCRLPDRYGGDPTGWQLMNRALAIRAAGLYLPAAAVIALWLWRRPGLRDRGGLLLSAAWNLPALLLLHALAMRWEWWSFRAEGGLLLGFPVDLYLGWVLLWGPVTALVFPSLSLVGVLALGALLDLVMMPAL